MLPLPTHRFPRRLGQLVPGLVLFGVGVALMVRADLGLSPWQVFHQGVAENTDTAMGTVVIATGIVVLLAWIPLRERFGLGTILNVALIGNVLNISLLILPDDIGSLPVRWAAMLGGISLIGLGSGLYIGAGMGPGPRGECRRIARSCDGGKAGRSDRTQVFSSVSCAISTREFAYERPDAR